MIGPLWKTIELLERKQNSLLTTIAVCSFCAAITLTVGIYKGEARAEAAQTGETKRVRTLKPITQFDDTGSSEFGDSRIGAGHPEWELRYATHQSIEMRNFLREKLQERNASSAEFAAADVEFLATVKQVSDLLVVIKAKLYLEQEASSKESKDAISKDVGDSG